MTIQVGPAKVDGCEIACVLQAPIQEIRCDYVGGGRKTMVRLGDVFLTYEQADKVAQAMQRRQCAYLVIPGDRDDDVRAENARLTAELSRVKAECRKLGGAG